MKQQKKVLLLLFNSLLLVSIDGLIIIYMFSECSNTSYNELRPFKCLDLTYISVLLEQGFGLPYETSVSVSYSIQLNCLE